MRREGLHPSKLPPLCRPDCPDADGNGRQRHPGGAAHLRRHLPQVGFKMPFINFPIHSFQGAGFTSEGSLNKLYLIFDALYINGLSSLV